MRFLLVRVDQTGNYGPGEKSEHDRAPHAANHPLKHPCKMSSFHEHHRQTRTTYLSHGASKRSDSIPLQYLQPTIHNVRFGSRRERARQVLGVALSASVKAFLFIHLPASVLFSASDAALVGLDPGTVEFWIRQLLISAILVPRELHLARLPEVLCIRLPLAESEQPLPGVAGLLQRPNSSEYLHIVLAGPAASPGRWWHRVR